MSHVSRRVFALLTRRERKRLGLVLGAMIGAAMFEAAGIASILPFLSLIGSPDLVQTNAILNWFYTTLGFRSVNRFLILVGFMVLAVLLISNFLSALTSWALLRFSWMRNNSLSLRLLTVYLGQPYPFFLTRNSSTLSRNILGEVQQVVQGILVPGMQMIAKGLVVLFILGLLVSVNPAIAAMVVVFLGSAYGVIYLIVRRRLTVIGKERLDANRNRFRTAAEAFGGFKIIKLLGIESYFVKRYAAHSFVYADRSARSAVIAMVPRYALETIAFGGILMVVLYLLLTGQDLAQMLPILGLYAFGGYRLIPALQAVFNGVANIRFATASLEALEEDLRDNSDIAQELRLPRALPEPLRLANRIELRHVSYRYPETSRSVVDDIDLTIPVGASVALAGRTGSGKTTIADLILGLIEPESGEILIDGVPLDRENVRSWQHSIGYVPQDIYLCDDSVVRNIAFGVPDEEIDREQVQRAAQIANIHPFIVNELPDGYDTTVGERGVRLSGGERQRLGIARALYRDPSFLVLDEATSALDGATEQAVYEAIRAATKAKTSLIIAHRLATVTDCDVICFIENGRIAAKGTYTELLEASPDFRRMAREPEQD